jgi:hypothetical protein
MTRQRRHDVLELRSYSTLATVVVVAAVAAVAAAVAGWEWTRDVPLNSVQISRCGEAASALWARPLTSLSLFA